MNICLSLTEINWSTTKDIVSIIGTISAVYIGLMGLSAWKRQLKGGHEYALAKGTLLKVYEVEKAIQAVRSPLFTLNAQEVENGNTLKEYLKAYDTRFSNLNHIWSELETNRIEGRVIWGSQIDSVFIEMEAVVKELYRLRHLQDWVLKERYLSGFLSGVSEDNQEKINKVFNSPSNDDEFSIQIKSAKSKIEAYLKTKLR